MDLNQITLIVPHLEQNWLNVACFEIEKMSKYPFLGLGYIAAALEKAGYKVQFIDMFSEELALKDLFSRLEKSPPSIVGITSNIINFVTAKRVASNIKQKYPDSYLIIGGPHTNLYHRELLMNSPFDAVVRGEGEETIVELVETLRKNLPLKGVKGISYKENGTIYVNENRPRITNLDEIPFPARHLMPLEQYYSVLAKKRKFTTIFASRGCPFRCTYCVEQGSVRFRSPQNIVDEIETTIRRFKIREFFFLDSTFTANMNHTSDICNEIKKRKVDIKWECRTRVDHVSEDLLKLMKEVGCQRIHYGVESGNPSILKILNKGFTLQQVINAIKWTKNAKIDVLAYFMIGSPGENRRTIAQSIQFAKKLDPDWALFSITVPPCGTVMYERALKQGIIKRDYWREFILGNINQVPRIAFETNEYTRDDLTKILKKAYFGFYFRPRIILRRLRKIRSGREFLNNMQGVLKFIRSLFVKI